MARWIPRSVFQFFTVCQQGVRQHIKRFFTPTLLNEDDRRKEVLLRVVLLASLLLASVCLLIVVTDTLRLGANYRGIPWWSMAAITALFLWFLRLLRHGHLRAASWGLFLLYLLPSLYASARWGIDLPMALLSDAFLIVMISVLFGTRPAFVLSMGIGGALFAFSWLGTEGILPVNRYWHGEIFNMGDGITIIILLLFLSLLCLLANREIELSLFRAKTSEALLRDERDLLEIRVQERTKALHRAQLEKMTQLQRFVEFGRVATSFFHDLASPLNSLALNLDLAKKTGGDEERDAHVYVQRAISVTGRLESFLKDVQRHMREDEANTTFSVTEAIHAVDEVLEYQAQKMRVTLHYEGPEEVTLYGKNNAFHRLLTNITLNAIDAYADVEEGVKREVLTQLTLQDNNVTINIKDHGCGISAEAAEHIWEPFYTTKPANRGLGIGLSMCKQIVEEDFGGTITYTSSPSLGTTFTITLPRYGRSDTGVNQAAPRTS